MTRRLCRALWRRSSGRRLLPAVAAAAVAASALGLCGCSYRLAALVSKDDTDTPTTTGVIAQPYRRVQVADASPSAEADLAFARAVVADVLSRGTRDASVPWQNPQTGAGGNITPLNTAYSEDGEPCRDFLASYVHGATQDWLQGAACRAPNGAWEVKRLKSLKPS